MQRQWRGKHHAICKDMKWQKNVFFHCLQTSQQVVLPSCYASHEIAFLFAFPHFFFLTWLSWHWDVILPGWLLTLESTSFVHSHRTNAAFCVLCHHFPFVILPSKGILVSDATWLALPLHLFCLKLLFFTLVMH